MHVKTLEHVDTLEHVYTRKEFQHGHVHVYHTHARTHTQTHTHKYMYIMYIYIYIHAHTHTHIYIYILKVIHTNSHMHTHTHIHITGPSGVGKGTLIERLKAEFPLAFGFSVSHTTRGPREGEKNGVHYNFTAREEMQKEIEKGTCVRVYVMYCVYVLCMYNVCV